jgi:hypothetical protein
MSVARAEEQIAVSLLVELLAALAEEDAEEGDGPAPPAPVTAAPEPLAASV